MSITVVCGVNWGDEGKGRMVDYLAHDVDVVVRYQGGNNAGHTVVNEHGTFKLHLIPSGIFNPKTTNVLGTGMVIDLEALSSELEGLKRQGIDVRNVKLSDRATICFPFHAQEDGWEEERLCGSAYGSTRRGIAPAYGDRYLKKAIQVGELFHEGHLKQRLEQLVTWKNLVAKGVYGQTAAVDFGAVWDWALTWRDRIAPLVCDTTEYLEGAAAAGKNILLEAQLGALRDIMYGIYPFTTSSSSLAGFAAVGAGLFNHAPDRVVGVMKAFSSCVGAGPFVTEMEANEAAALREVAFEYGAATGRPRRIGHFDAVASRYGAAVQGTTEVALTKLDSLSGRDKLRICTHYEVDGKRTDRFPLVPLLDIARPIYTEMRGWSEDISGARTFDALPKAAQDYVLALEKAVEVRIRYVSVGPERESLIDRGQG